MLDLMSPGYIFIHNKPEGGSKLHTLYAGGLLRRHRYERFKDIDTVNDQAGATITCKASCSSSSSSGDESEQQRSSRAAKAGNGRDGSTAGKRMSFAASWRKLLGLGKSRKVVPVAADKRSVFDDDMPSIIKPTASMRKASRSAHGTKDADSDAYTPKAPRKASPKASFKSQDVDTWKQAMYPDDAAVEVQAYGCDIL